MCDAIQSRDYLNICFVVNDIPVSERLCFAENILDLINGS